MAQVFPARAITSAAARAGIQIVLCRTLWRPHPRHAPLPRPRAAHARRQELLETSPSHAIIKRLFAALAYCPPRRDAPHPRQPSAPAPAMAADGSWSGAWARRLPGLRVRGPRTWEWMC